MKKANPFELMELLGEVLEDINFSPEDPAIISITIDRIYVGGDSEFGLRVQLMSKDFERFMFHVRTRAEHIGEEIAEPVMEPLSANPEMLRVSWQGVPGLEFLAIQFREDN